MGLREAWQGGLWQDDGQQGVDDGKECGRDQPQHSLAQQVQVKLKHSAVGSAESWTNCVRWHGREGWEMKRKETHRGLQDSAVYDEGEEGR